MPTARKLNPALRRFIQRQPLFFVATAGRDSRVNMSPKGMDTLRIIDDSRIVWLNLSGSGNETAAHIRDQNRMTLMFCALSGDALILRLYGQAKVLHPRDAGWGAALAQFPKIAGSRQVFDMSIDLVQTSCGSGVPVMEVRHQRGETELAPFYDAMGSEGVQKYWARKNVETINGIATGIFKEG